MLYIYYKEKVNLIRVKKHVHLEIIKISLVALLHICSLLKVRFKKKKKKIMKPKINAKSNGIMKIN